jgi:hypothetical protein
MEYLKEHFDYNYYINENNLKVFKCKDSAFNHWIHIGIYENLNCNEDMEFLNNIKSIIHFIKNIGETLKYEEKKNIIVNSIKNKNNFNFDERFFIEANDLDNQINCFKYYYDKGHAQGLIFNKKQLEYYYDNLNFLEQDNKIYVEYNNKKIILHKFCKEYIYDKNQEYFLDNFNIIDNKLKNNKLCCILHIGNIEIGLEIINKLKSKLKNNNFSLIVNINIDEINHTKINILMKEIESFKNFLITTTPNFGNDISPFLIIYNYLLKNFTFEYLLKIHSKSNKNWRIKLIDCFIDKDFDNLFSLFNNNIGMMGNGQFLFDKDSCNENIISKIYEGNIEDYQFIGGTIFLTTFKILEDVIKLDIVKSLLLFPYYITNYLFYNNSLPHSFERIFSYEIYKKNKYIYGLDNFKKNIFIIFHVGNITTFNEILDEYPYICKAEKILISIHNNEFKKYILSKISTAHIITIENKGMDVGGFLKSIEYILKNKLNDKKYFYIKLHTKSDPNWRKQLITPIFENLDLLIKYPRNKPFLFGAKDCIIRNKVVNRKYIKDIIDRNNLDIYKFEKYLDEYHFLDLWFDGKTHQDLILNEKFYSYYEYLLNPKDHWKNFGKNEFHRLSNPCYIKKLGIISYFVAGTLFAFNEKFLNLLSKINLSYEYIILEGNYAVNDISRKTHAWEYLFSLLLYTNNSYVISIDNNNLITNKESKNKDKIQTILNVPINNSKIAFFLLVPEESTKFSGGYKTLLRYISWLNKIGLSCDIYFGDRWEHMETNDRGFNLLEHCDMHQLINFIKDCNELDVKMNNFYLGLRCQRNYDLIIANAWHTADPALRNKEKTKKLGYIIQDLEYLFYPDNEEIINKVKSTYKNNFNYYCLSGYLTNHFESKFDSVHKSCLGYNYQDYYDMNLDRENAILLTYYTYKPGRLPDLVEKIIKKLSASKIKCYVFPDSFKIESEYIEFVGKMNIKELNKIYNKVKIGLVFSNTNPSRIGYEMYASGLKVIEYNGDFTKYDIPDKYFTKINNDEDIDKIVKKLFASKSINSEEYKQSITIDVEKKNVINYFKNLLE